MRFTPLEIAFLNGVKEKYARRKRHIFQKIAKKTEGTGKQAGSSEGLNLEEKGHRYEQKLVLEELRRLTGLVKKLERRIAKIEEKVVGKSKSKNQEK